MLAKGFLLLGMVLIRRHGSSYDQLIEAHARKGSLSIYRRGPCPQKAFCFWIWS